MTQIKPNIYWVGGIDWNLRNFHGYETEEGSSYNAYLIVDEQITLIDTVKAHLFEEMLSRIKEIIDPSKIDNIISCHTEMDHSGSILQMLEVAKNAKLYASVNGVKNLKKHFHSLENIETCTEGMVLNIGKYDLTFNLQQMLHWPDNMSVYVEKEKILFSNDGFGQHIASGFRWDDEYPQEMLFYQVAKYYANILIPYKKMLAAYVERAVVGRDIEFICPAHGIMFRSHIAHLLSEYGKWISNELENRAVIVYDSMWKSSEKMANALQRGMEDAGIHAQLRNLNYNHISNIMTDLLDAKIIAIGSPTLNSAIMPNVAAFLNYMTGLKPTDRIGFAFGSYGWGGESIPQIDAILRTLPNWSFPIESKKAQYVPTEEDLTQMYEHGKNLAQLVLAKS